MRVRDVLGLAVSLGVAIALVLTVETRYDLGDAWVGIVGVLAGSLVSFVADRVRAREEAATRSADLAAVHLEQRRAWARERRFAAYEDAMIATKELSRCVDAFARQGSYPSDLVERFEAWRDALIRVQMWGTRAMRGIASEAGGFVMPTVATPQDEREHEVSILVDLVKELGVQVQLELVELDDFEGYPELRHQGAASA